MYYQHGRTPPHHGQMRVKKVQELYSKYSKLYSKLYSKTHAAMHSQRPLAIPTTPLLSDAELRARRARLARAREKLPHIPLQAVAMEDVFVMVSLSKYDLYSMARGPYAGCKVAAVQTNDDAKEEETQTNEPAQRAYAAQVPDDRNKMSEAEVFAFSMEVGASGGAEARSRVQASSTMGAATSRVMNMSPGMELKLAQFIRWAGPLMLACLGMAPSGKEVTFRPPAAGSQGLSGGLLHLNWPELLDQRPVTALAACPNPLEPLLLVAYGPDHSLGSRGCLCVWDLSAPERPRHVLISEGAPTCCAFGPPPASHLVFAGMEEGGVCAWDLDEPSSRHPSELLGGKPTPARRPSFSTEGAPIIDTGLSPCLGPITGVATVSKEGGSRTTPCNVLAVTAWGEVHVYTASLVSGADGGAADMDTGMRIGSRLRLLRNAGVVRLGLAALQSVDTLMTPVPAFCLMPLSGPKYSGQVIVGSDAGRCLRGSWVGTAPAPKVFLAADQTSPAAVSSAAARVLASTTRCLAASPFLPQDASRPVLQEAFMVQGNDPTLAALPTQLVAAGLQPGGKSTAAVPMFALGYDDGSVRAHALAPAHQAGPGVEVEVRVMQQLLNLPQQTLVANGHGGAGK
ncbi:hypothetical protein QJQ45_003427 [Haematococcus lacustris]|nr:hypothetical protein QJQ45_003427 [Haematococcus lacustris]